MCIYCEFKGKRAQARVGGVGDGKSQRVRPFAERIGSGKPVVRAKGGAGIKFEALEEIWKYRSGSWLDRAQR